MQLVAGGLVGGLGLSGVQNWLGAVTLNTCRMFEVVAVRLAASCYEQTMN